MENLTFKLAERKEPRKKASFWSFQSHGTFTEFPLFDVTSTWSSSVTDSLISIPGDLLEFKCKKLPIYVCRVSDIVSDNREYQDLKMTDRCSPVVGTERKGDRDKGRERPIFEPGELVSSDDGVFAFRIIQLVGEGRYKTSTISLTDVTTVFPKASSL